MNLSPMRSAAFAFASLAILSLVTACKKDSSSTTTTTTTTTAKHGTGWTGTDDPKKVPQALNTAKLVGSTAPLPASVDLSPFTPPVGNQAQTSTCVGWATGYYGKTISEAVANNYGQDKVGNASYQLSPADLFLSIPDDKKGTDCQSGTQIVYALDQLVSSGVATMATAPWQSDISNCSVSQVQDSWNTDAANHKITYYRTIDATVQGIKEQLASNNPVLMGIKVSNEFEQYQGGVISTATFPSPVGLHAQCIMGYDDAKNAFHCVNSWGTGWGEQGFYWIDYNSLVNDYIANGNVYYMASSSTNNVVNPPTTVTTSSVDLAAWIFSDISTVGDETDNPDDDPTARKMFLNIYNIGQDDVTPASDWSYYYLYYNAYDADDYGVIFHDEFNTSVGQNSFACPNNNACTFNITIPAGSDFAKTAYNTQQIYRNYSVPTNLDGDYYLVLVVDPANVLKDVNTQNNLFYTTGQTPVSFTSGVVDQKHANPGGVHDGVRNEVLLSREHLFHSGFNSTVNEHNRNAYTPQEIIGFLKTKATTGELKTKINSNDKKKHAFAPQIN